MKYFRFYGWYQQGRYIDLKTQKLFDRDSTEGRLLRRCHNRIVMIETENLHQCCSQQNKG